MRMNGVLPDGEEGVFMHISSIEKISQAGIRILFTWRAEK